MSDILAPCSGAREWRAIWQHRQRLRSEALQIPKLIQNHFEEYKAMPDSPDKRIHSLFAEFYFCVTEAWLNYLQQAPYPEFSYRVIVHFYALYEAVVTHVRDNTASLSFNHWSSYLKLARRQTLRTPISGHLILVSLSVRAHTRYDLAYAIRSAKEDFAGWGYTKQDIDFGMRTVLDRTTNDAFFAAALKFISLHRERQYGWRRLVLGLFGLSVRTFRPILFIVFQSWRRAAGKDAEKEDATRTAALDKQYAEMSMDFRSGACCNAAEGGNEV